MITYTDSWFVPRESQAHRQVAIQGIHNMCSIGAVSDMSNGVIITNVIFKDGRLPRYAVTVRGF